MSLPTDSPPPSSQNRLSWILGTIFVFALLMGPGPGLYLVNGWAAEGSTLFGLPLLYVWALFWCGVEAAVVIVAFRKLWRDES